MTELTITEQDVASFRAKLDAWVATLDDGEQVILQLVAMHAFGRSADDAGDEVEGLQMGGGPAPGALFEIEDYSFDIEQTLNIGSQSTGAGSGKITFNPFSITSRGLGQGTLDRFIGTRFVR
jgi:hypothetical protein